MKVLRNLFVALSFGFMVSCSNGLEGALSDYESLVAKVEKCETLEDLTKLADEGEKLEKAVKDAIEAEKKAGKTDEQLAEFTKKYNELNARAMKAVSKFSK